MGRRRGGKKQLQMEEAIEEGRELGRRGREKEAFCMVMPLLTKLPGAPLAEQTHLILEKVRKICRKD